MKTTGTVYLPEFRGPCPIWTERKWPPLARVAFIGVMSALCWAALILVFIELRG